MSLGNKMFLGMIWNAFERMSIQAVSFLLGIILARLLTPTEYGTVGLLIVFISFSQVFIDSGFSKALIQKQERTNDDISTVFLFSIFIALVFYVILWVSAPLIADFYEIIDLTNLLRVLSISLIFNALFSIPLTLFTINLNFKVIAKVNFIATLISGGIAVYMAYKGYGAWALVGQTLIKSIITAILMWTQVKWRPTWVFSIPSLKTLFSFGSKLLISSLLSNLVNNFYSLFIAKLISTKDLGYYTRGTQFSDTIYGSISTIFDNVLLPTLSTVQNQRELLIQHTRRIIRSAAIIVLPLFLGLSVMSEPIITVLLKEKWLPAVPIMQILCIARLITIISGINVNLLYVIGRTDLALRQQYVKLIIRVILLVIALQYGIVYIALAELLSTAIHFFINTYYPGRIMKYGAIQQIKDMMPIILASLAMALFAYFCMYWIPNDLYKLLIIPILASIFYFGIIYTIKLPELFFLIDKIKAIKKK
ncbi:lipopolysaccharide biosynthesis protein [uncultured Maribacter sp.]|uniref:lipopolysaccharide biosynthesis protein n=1 Tax=uncultured Maribacter sp. TaxID=431308 RepID=UPI00260764CD|nr:lipopolysaccharide biosynthesis protein [uncultured Maribacter sp.]